MPEQLVSDRLAGRTLAPRLPRAGRRALLAAAAGAPTVARADRARATPRPTTSAATPTRPTPAPTRPACRGSTPHGFPLRARDGAPGRRPRPARSTRAGSRWTSDGTPAAPTPTAGRCRRAPRTQVCQARRRALRLRHAASTAPGTAAAAGTCAGSWTAARYTRKRINGDAALTGYCYRGRKVFCVHVLPDAGAVLTRRRSPSPASSPGVTGDVVAVRVLDDRHARRRPATAGGCATTLAACATFALGALAGGVVDVRRAGGRSARCCGAGGRGAAVARRRWRSPPRSRSCAARASCRRSAGRCPSPGGGSCRCRSPAGLYGVLLGIGLHDLRAHLRGLGAGGDQRRARPSRALGRGASGSRSASGARCPIVVLAPLAGDRAGRPRRRAMAMRPGLLRGLRGGRRRVALAACALALAPAPARPRPRRAPAGHRPARAGERVALARAGRQRPAAARRAPGRAGRDRSRRRAAGWSRGATATRVHRGATRPTAPRVAVRCRARAARRGRRWLAWRRAARTAATCSRPAAGRRRARRRCSAVAPPAQIAARRWTATGSPTRSAGRAAAGSRSATCGPGRA